MKIKQLIYGVASFIPGVDSLYQKFQSTGGTIDARYCYSIWMRHLIMMDLSNHDTNPSVVAELGPGDSIGIGIMALLTGSSRLIALDVVQFASIENNIRVFNELVEMLRGCEDIPGENEYPKVKPYLNDYKFPHKILTKNRMDFCLKHDRIKIIRDSIMNYESSNSVISYKAPWFDDNIITDNVVDYLISNSVLEHVNDLELVYKSMYIWLKKGGVMGHQVDFKCHGTASEWNGHWKYSDFLWSLIRGNRIFLLNRSYLSIHLNYINKYKFDNLKVLSTILPSNIQIEELQERFSKMTEKDLIVSSAFIQCIK